MDLHKLTDERIVFLDGAMGTMLQRKGLKAGESPESWNLVHQDKIIEVHKEYIEAGSDIVNTNTFGGNTLKLKEYNLQDKLEEINGKAVEAAKKARDFFKRDVFISGSIGPTGEFVKPVGNISFDEMYEIYYRQVKALGNAGADLINFETMVDIGELRIAVLAAKDAVKIPIFANLTFNEDGRTLTGSDVFSAFNILEGLGVDFIGTNCGMGPDEMGRMINGINQLIDTKIVVQANAGIPKLIDGKTVFTCSPHDYVKQLEKIVEEGVNIIGGCCGTTPEFIKMVKEKFKDSLPKKIRQEKKSRIKLSSTTGTFMISRETPFCKIGEKINPSALKKIADDIRLESQSNMKETARKQEEAGAHVLDINLGLGGSDETKSFQRVIPEMSSFTKLPLCIDTTDPKALEEALRLYPGRALINSISAEKERMEKILPLMKKYGAYAVFLPLDEKGIPETAEERIKVIKKVLNEAEKYGLGKERFLVDALVMTVSANPKLAKVSVETIRLAYEELGLLSTCGLSNISFGLPGRNAVNASFLSMLMGAGLDSAILNPEDELLSIMIDAGNVLYERDIHAISYIKKYQQVKNFFKDNQGAQTANTVLQEQKKVKNETLEDKIYAAVVEGSKEEITGLLAEGIKKYNAQELLNRFMIPAITYVGDLYDKKVYYLPQLMLSAETMKKGTEYLEPYLKQETRKFIATIIIATVKGDIHDIGKNIVSIMLENNGFKVIDLGKDVSKEIVLEKALEHKADIICLSALMTTTMVEMGHFKEYMKAQRKEIPLMIGGAVVNQDYAASIGAYFSKDAVEAVERAKQIIGSINKKG